MKQKVAVMAGTMVDTQMGVDFIRRANPELEPLFYATAHDPREQLAFQLGSEAERCQLVAQMVRDAQDKGAGALLVYCNSLSASLDIGGICAGVGLPLVTPLMAHRRLAARSAKLGLIAANNQSLCGIEAVMYQGNPDCDVLGASQLPMVLAIEAKTPPAQIAEELGLDELLRYFEKNQVERVVLGCTHFPYMAEELARRTSLEIFNPDDLMYEMLMERLTTA